MSKRFLTLKEVILKIGNPNGLSPSDTFATRLDCESIGADYQMLGNYEMTQYPVDDDIVGSETRVFIQNHPIAAGTPYSFPISAPFNPGKGNFNLVYDFQLSPGQQGIGNFFNITNDANGELFMVLQGHPQSGLLLIFYTSGGTIDGTPSIFDRIYLEGNQVPDGARISLGVTYTMGILYINYNGKLMYNKDVTFGNSITFNLLKIGELLGNGTLNNFNLVEMK